MQLTAPPNAWHIAAGVHRRGEHAVQDVQGPAHQRLVAPFTCVGPSGPGTTGVRLMSGRAPEGVALELGTMRGCHVRE